MGVGVKYFSRGPWWLSGALGSSESEGKGKAISPCERTGC